MSEFRDHNDLRTGDRVLYTPLDGKPEVRTVSYVHFHIPRGRKEAFLIGGVCADVESLRRIVEPGERVPVGAVVQWMSSALAGNTSGFYVGRFDQLCRGKAQPVVLLSLPEPEPDPEPSKRERLLAEIDALRERVEQLEDGA